MQEHYTDPGSGAWVFPVRPGEAADDQIKRLAAAMLVVVRCMKTGLPVPSAVVADLEQLKGN